MTPPRITNNCMWCGRDVLVEKGLLAAHKGGDPWTCMGSHRVPWRLGTPDEATVRRHLQQHPSVEIPAALFQVRWMGVFPGIVAACFDDSGAVQWGYGFATDAKEKVHAGILAMHSSSVDDLMAWNFRPIDILSHEPRAWRDGED